MAEWLRRLPAKQFPSGSVGSNPAVVVFWIKKREGREKKGSQKGHKFFQKNGDAGYRSPCPSHAKRMLYHMSYTPNQEQGRKGQHKAEKEERKKQKTKNSPTGIRTPVFHVTGEDTNQLYYWRQLKRGEATAHKGNGQEEGGKGEKGKGKRGQRKRERERTQAYVRERRK